MRHQTYHLDFSGSNSIVLGLLTHQLGTALFQQPKTALLFEQSGRVLTHQPETALS